MNVDKQIDNVYSILVSRVCRSKNDLSPDQLPILTNLADYISDISMVDNKTFEVVVRGIISTLSQYVFRFPLFNVSRKYTYLLKAALDRLSRANPPNEIKIRYIMDLIVLKKANNFNLCSPELIRSNGAKSVECFPTNAEPKVDHLINLLKDGIIGVGTGTDMNIALEIAEKCFSHTLEVYKLIPRITEESFCILLRLFFNPLVITTIEPKNPSFVQFIDQTKADPGNNNLIKITVHWCDGRTDEGYEIEPRNNGEKILLQLLSNANENLLKVFIIIFYCFEILNIIYILYLIFQYTGILFINRKSLNRK
jgi:hypothetical protein